MLTKDSKQEWDDYCKEELQKFTPLILNLGFTLNKEQVHIGGERHLMSHSRDVGGGGRKLILMGKRAEDNKKVIIKISSEKEGLKEIENERKAREVLDRINFAYRNFFMPQEILFQNQNNKIIFITSYIEQERTFITRSLNEQFFLALQAFDTQEGVHATTYSHTKTIKEAFGIADAKYYFNSFAEFRKTALINDPLNTSLAQTLDRAQEFLLQNKQIIDRYCGFLTHSDFVPNNLRVSGNNMFLLDYASIHFGNKYESWARFINYMVHHNRALESALSNYVRQNRGAEEYLSLRLMRVYKLGFLLQFYTKCLHKTTGNSLIITKLRIDFWTKVMAYIIEDKEIPRQLVVDFTDEEDSMRTEGEIKRQAEMLGGKRLL